MLAGRVPFEVQGAGAFEPEQAGAAAPELERLASVLHGLRKRMERACRYACRSRREFVQAELVQALRWQTSSIAAVRETGAWLELAARTVMNELATQDRMGLGTALRRAKQSELPCRSSLSKNKG